MRKQTWKIVAIAIAVLFLAYWLGYIGTQPGQVAPGAPPTTPTVPVAPEVEYESAALKWAIHCGITGDDVGTGSTSYVDIYTLKNGVFDPLKKDEGVEYASAPEASALTYNYMDEVVFRVTSDKDHGSGTDMGNETYTRWFYCKLAPGEPIKELTLACLSASQSSPSYKYRVNDVGPDTGWDVQYIAGTTPYWGMGAFEVYSRIGDKHLDIYLTYSGQTLSKVTDASTWVDTDAETTTNVTLATDTEDMYFKLLGEKTDMAFGLPQLVVQQNGKIEEYRAVAVMATNATSIGLSALTADGWLPMTKVDVTGELLFYKVLNPQIPVAGSKFDYDIEISIDASALSASTVYATDLWVYDWQLPANVAAGAVTTSLPTAYGVTNDHGCDDVMHSQALTVASSVTETEQLLGIWTTAA